MDKTADLITEYAALDDTLAKMKPHIARHKALRAELVAIAEKQPGAGPAKMLTLQHPSDQELSLYFTPRAEERTPVIEKIRKYFGAAVFAKLATITLKALDANATETEQLAHKLVTRERTGPRIVTVVRKLPTVAKDASTRD